MKKKHIMLLIVFILSFGIGLTFNKTLSIKAFDDEKSKKIISNYNFDEIVDENIKNIAKTLIGIKAPNIKMKDLQGNLFELNKLTGQNIVLEVAYASCEACKEITPLMNEIEKKYKDVTFVKIYPRDNKDTIEKLFNELNLELPKNIIAGQDNIGNTLIDDYNIKFYPTLIFIDKDGYIVDLHIGTLTEDRIQDIILKRFNNSN